MRSARRLGLILLLCLAGSAASSTYTLKWGDTLGKVAARYKIPLPALTAANNIANPHKVREGTVLQVPDKQAAQVAVAKPIAAVSAPPPADGSKTYGVKAGDTLSSIAKQFGTTVADIVERNGLKSADAVLREGRTLKLAPSADVPPPQQPLCPVKGASKFDFSNSFGAPRHGGRKHMGNDVFAKRGTPVVAGVDGTIRAVTGSITGIGYYLDGDDGVTYYGAHMDVLKVAEGRVKQGDVIGAVGTTGNAQGTPAHLHFEVHPGNGPAIDPYRLLQTWCH
jgi:murein DD-endopeptidase MepM/ murein hydrolase activator NlpD